MQNHPKHLGVLNAVAAKADWGKPLPAGVHRGVAQFMGYGSYSAAVAEVSVNDKGKLKVHRMVLGVNCGHAVNPDQIAAQVEGSVAYGLSATFYGECTSREGPASRRPNFHTYEILRLKDMPKIETVIVPTQRLLGRRRRTDDLRRRARGAERHRRGDGQAGAQPAVEAHADGVTSVANRRMRANTDGPRQRRRRKRSARVGLAVALGLAMASGAASAADPPTGVAMSFKVVDDGIPQPLASAAGDAAQGEGLDPRARSCELRVVSCHSRCRAPVRRRCRPAARRRRRAG